MAINGLEKDDRLQDRELKMREVAFRVRIQANATPASKVHQGEIANVAVIRSQGKTAQADAIEDLSASWTAAADATGIFGVLLKGDELGQVDRIISATITALDGSTTTVAGLSCGGLQAGLSPAGNIALQFDSSLSLAAANVDVIVDLKYYLQ